MQQTMRWLVALGLVFGLSACSTVKGWFESDEDDPTAPVELVDIDQTVNIKKRWSVGVGNGNRAIAAIGPRCMRKPVVAVMTSWLAT